MGSWQGRGRTGQDQTLPVTGATAATHASKQEISVNLVVSGFCLLNRKYSKEWITYV